MTQVAVAQPGAAALDAPDARPPAETPAAGGPTPRRRGPTAALVAGLTALVGIPLAVALAVVRKPTWFPSVDMALIEMRVRDVATTYNPVLGAGGRFTAFGEQGNHPGPLPYYVLTPVYRLFGSDSWALEAAAVSVGLAAVAVGIWVAHRRAGVVGALVATLGYLLLVLIYDPIQLLSPWNPNVAMLWWVTLLLALWGVICRDYALLPVAAFAAGLCSQAHISYLGLAGGLAIVVGIFVAVDVVRNPPLRRPFLRWLLVGVVVELVLWAPPLYEQFQVGTGNLTIMWDSFTDPKDDPITFSIAWDIVIGLLDLTTVFTNSAGSKFGNASGDLGPAWVLLVLWALSVGGAAWLRRPWLTRLHVITAAAMATSFIAVVRITGVPWWYLVLWGRGTAVLAAVTVVVTAALVGATLWQRRRGGSGADDATAEEPATAEDPATAEGPATAEEPVSVEATAAAPPEETRAERRARLRQLPKQERRAQRREEAWALRIRPVTPPPATARRLTIGLGAAIAVAVWACTVEGADAPGFDPDLSRSMGALLAPTEEALDADGPRDEQTLVTFADPVGLGSSGFTMILALERDGFDVRAGPSWESAVGDRRLTTPDDADRQVHVSVGDGDIARWRSDDRMEEIASFDPRTEAERAEVREAEAAIVAELEARGLEKQARLVERARMVALTDPDMPEDVKSMIHGLADFPQPVSVFLSSRPGVVPEIAPAPAPASPPADGEG